MKIRAACAVHRSLCLLDAVRLETARLVLLAVLPSYSRAGSLPMVLLAWAMVLGGAFSSGALHAEEDRVDRMSTELRNNEDFRVRTQAALALGASKDKRAVSALCDGLDDSITTVRAAAAAALGKLALGGKKCLESHIDTETNASVKSVLAKALEKVKGGSKPAITSETKYYVAIGPTTDKSGRDGTDVDDMVHQAMEGSSSELDGCVIAPRDEKPSDAKSVLGKHKDVKAFFLWPKVMPPDYSNGNLTIRLEIAIFTYPGKALKGTIPLKLTMPDVSSKDKSSEDDLIKQAAESAFKRFSSNAERFGE